MSIGHLSVIEHCHGNGKFLNDIEMEKYLSKGKNFNQVFGRFGIELYGFLVYFEK